MKKVSAEAETFQSNKSVRGLCLAVNYFFFFGAAFFTAFFFAGIECLLKTFSLEGLDCGL